MIGLVTAALVALGATATSLGSTPPASGGSSSSGASPAYIESPQAPVTTVTTYPTYGGSFYGDGYYGGGYYRGSNYAYSTYTWYPRRYFFPPTPPALGEPYVKNRTKSASLVRSTIPLTLSDYVGEPFYSPLSPFLFEESISKRRQKMLDDYTTQRSTLVAELRAKIASLENADPATRESQLAEFAREQTPRIMELEKTAEDIRADLTHWSLFSDTSDWNEGRTWRLGDDTRYESTLDESKVMRGAAFYQEGLSPAQRRLLREYSMQLDESGNGAANDTALNTRGPFFYFSPETSRIRLPANLPPELQAKIAAYRQQKSAIIKELRDTLYRHDRDLFDYSRRGALRTLAEKQGPEIAALEPLAEDIRRGLAALPNPSQPPPPAKVLPPKVADRISSYMTQRTALLEALNGKVQELKRQFPSSRVETVRMQGGIGVLFVPYRKLGSDDARKADAAREQLAAFNEQQVNAYVSIIHEKEQIREALVESAGPLAPIVTPRIVDVILLEFASVLQQQEMWHVYHDYQVAVLQPGLSPEQRRLLFTAGLLKLDLQLPSYTY